VPTIKEVIEDLDWLTDRISTQVRTISVSLLAITWGLLIGKPEISQPLPLWLKKNLLPIGILALVAMFSDFLQYIFGMLVVDSLRKSMEEKKQAEAKYDYGTKPYKLREFFFWAKLVLAIIACLWFLTVIIPFCVGAIRTPSS